MEENQEQDKMIEETENIVLQPIGKKPWYNRHKVLLILLGVVAVIGLAIVIAAIVDGVNGITVLGDFITKQILGMQWLNTLIGMAFTGMFGAEFMATHWGMLSKAVKPKLLFWFILIVVVGIVAIGYIFNTLNFLFI